MENKKNIETVRHSLSHVLAAAVLEMFPEAKLGIGPAIESGFYYDFDLPRTLIPEDLPILEDKMRKIIKGNYRFEKKSASSESASQLVGKSGQIYKKELIDDLIKEGEKEVSFYALDDFVDLCKGPHVESTSELRNLGFKLEKIAGAYWKGNEKNKMLQRIYGLAFDSKEELKKYEELIIEAEKRDHKKIGKELDLFSFHPESPGMPFWHENGMILWNILENFGKTLRKKYGFVEIKTPILAKNSLWITSGHWDHYKDGMFTFELNNETYGVKPMDCPFNIQIYQTKQHSYKELPIRYTEIGRVYRNEKSGELNGLLRVQEITQDDSHIFATEDQIGKEIVNLLDMIDEYYDKLSLTPEFFLSTRPDDFMGQIKTWDAAEKELKEALESKKIKYSIKEKDGAFYGPKIDVNIKDALGRSWQVATIQLDFQLPQRFKCEYIDEASVAKTPIMIHAAVFGSFERMIGILLEHFAGALPSWLAPVQAIVLPISTDKHLEYSKKIGEDLSKEGVRVKIDERNESVGKKIREAELQKIPYMLIVGDKEIETKKVAVRKYGEGDTGQKDQKTVASEINKM
jgi:threonyl-tRNA synthetase